MSKSNAQREAESRYRKKMHQIVVRYSPSDVGIYEYVKASGGASYIKRLVAEDIERGGVDVEQAARGRNPK